MVQVHIVTLALQYNVPLLNNLSECKLTEAVGDNNCVIIIVADTVGAS